MKKKIYTMGAVITALFVIAVAGILVINIGKRPARSAKVLEINGTCSVERGGKVLGVTEGMKLFTDDILVVGKGSSTRIRIDEDKFIFLGENSRLNLLVTGTKDESKTTAYLECGSMLTEVKHKLSANSSYAVVTPNTSMNIRGTKTLTEVYQDVLGAIKTNAAVVEGQVSFKVIQKDSTGKAVTVTTELSVGAGLGVTTDSKDLLDELDVKHIAEDGILSDGKEVEDTSHEELGTKLETPVFSEEFLNNVVAVLAQSSEEDVSDGFVAGDITEEELNKAINILNDVIDGKVEMPASIEEYIISKSQNYYEESIVNDTTESDSNDPDTDGADLGDLSDATVIGENDVAAGDGEGGGETTEENDIDDTNDDEKTEDGESEEERLAREEKKRLEKEEAERIEKEEQEKKEKEERERLEREEQEKKEKEEKEKAEKEEAEKEEKERIEKEAQEKEEREAAEREEAERAAREAAEWATQENGGAGSGGSGSGGSSSAYNVTFKEPSNRTFTVPSGFDYSVSGNIGLKLVFKQSGGTSSNRKYTASELSEIRPGELLPGYNGSAYDAYVVSDDIVGEGGEYIYTALSSYVAFTGWYTSEASARNGIESDRVMTMPSSGTVELWPGMEEVYPVVIVNRYEKAADFVIPTYTSGNVVRYEVDSEEIESGHVDAIQMLVKKGTSLALPAVRSTDIQTTRPYLKKDTAAGQSTDFFCYTVTAMDNNEYFNPSKVYLDGSSPAMYGEGVSLYYRTDGSESVLVDKPLFICAYYVSEVEVRVLDNAPGTILVNEYGSDDAAQSVGDYYDDTVASGEPCAVLPNGYPEGNDYNTAWKVTKTVLGEGADLITFKTGYFGLEMQIPKFIYQKASRPDGWAFSDGSYQRELLCNYRISNDGLTYGYDSIYPVVFHTATSDQTAFPFDGSAIEGKYVFTVQAVDWVYVGAGTGADVYYVVEPNDPYVINAYATTSGTRYKFAVDPVNLFAISNQGTSTRIIYAPGDIEPRDADPSNIYRNEIIGISGGSYSFVGAQGYRLTGYSFNLNLTCNDAATEHTLQISDAVPVLISGTERKVAYKLSFGDVISYNGTYFDWDHLLRAPLELTLVFEPALSTGDVNGPNP